MIYAILDGDLVVGVANGVASGVPVPDALMAVPRDRLRWNGAALVDAAAINSFYLDPFGRKRIAQGDPSWPAVTCAYDAAVIDDGGTWRLSTTADDLAAAKVAKKAAVDAQLAALYTAGWTYGGVMYQIDPDSQANITAMGALASASVAGVPGAAAWPAGFYWIAADNSHEAMTAAQMFAFAQAVAGHVSALILFGRGLKDQIDAATTAAAVDAIDVTTGWPA